MSHEIEIAADGTALAVYNRTPAWHQLGTVVDNPNLGLVEAMELAHLSGWDVRKVPVVGYDGDDAIDAPRWQMTVRNNPVDKFAPADPLGIVSPAYTVVQNEEAFGFGQAIMDAGLIVEAGGSLFNGRQPFLLFRTPDTIKIGGEDEVQPYLHMATSHDGSLSVTANLTGIRVVCWNTQSMALALPTPRYTVRHIGEGIEGKVQDAREALELTWEGISTFQMEAERMLDREVTAAEFDKVVEGLFPEPKSDATISQTLNEQKRDTYRELYETASTQANIRGTAWAALQAAWEMDEWTMAPDDAVAAASRSVNREDARRRIAARVQKSLALV